MKKQPNILLIHTIIVFTSDHGEMLGDHYRFRKTLAYEPSARVPFLISAPPEFGLGRGSVVDAAATHADILPTLLDMLGLAIPDTVDGSSLFGFLRGEPPTEWRECLHIEHAPNHHGLTDGREKYIWWPADGREQFFDLTDDPQETRDLALRADVRVAAWRERLIERLRDRPEGFVRDGKLVVGRPYGPVIPWKP